MSNGANLVLVACPHCNATFKVKDTAFKIMRNISCPKCKKPCPLKPAAIPTAAPSAPAPAAKPPDPVTSAPDPTPAVEPVASVPAVTSETMPPLSAPAPEAAKVTPPTPSSPPEPVKAIPPAAPVLDEKSGEVVFCCPHCSRELRIPKIHAGKKIRCKQCQNVQVVPTVAPPPAPAAEPVPAPVPVVPPTPPVVVPETVKREMPPPPPLVASPPAIPVAPLATTPITPAMSIEPLRASSRAIPSQETMAELQRLRDRISELETAITSAQHRADDAEKEVHNITTQRTTDAIAANRRIADLEAQIKTLQKTSEQRDRDNAEAQQAFREQIVADLNSKLKKRLGELSVFYQSELDQAETRVAELRHRLSALNP